MQIQWFTGWMLFNGHGTLQKAPLVLPKIRA
jgi:hypothetical protein